MRVPAQSTVYRQPTEDFSLIAAGIALGLIIAMAVITL